MAEELVFDEVKLGEARDMLDEIQNDLYDADNLLYDAVMKISYARGIDQVEIEDSAIDMRMPEKWMIQCREETKNISDTLDYQIQSIEKYTGDNISGSGGQSTSVAQARKVELTDTNMEVLEETANGKEVPPTTPMIIEKVNTNRQLLYGPAPITIDPPVQALYGPDPVTSAPITSGPITSPQLLYGPAPITIDPPVQALYGPAPQPRVDTGYTPSTSDTVSHTISLPGGSEYEPIPETSSTATPNTSTVEYSAIPETGVGMKRGFGDYIAPAAIGAAAGIIGMGISKARKKEQDEEENEE